MTLEKKEGNENLPKDKTPKNELKPYEPKHADKKLDTSDSDSKKADEILKKSMGRNEEKPKDYSKSMGRNEESSKDSTKKGMGRNQEKPRDYSKSMGMIINDEKYQDAPRKIKIEGSKVDLLMNDSCKAKIESLGLTINPDSKNNGGIEVKGFNGKKFTLNNETYIAEMSISKDKGENNGSVQINILNKNGSREKYFIKKNGSQVQLLDGNTGKVLIN